MSLFFFGGLSRLMIVQRFAQLFYELDESRDDGMQVSALLRYFKDAPAADAVWALFFLYGKRLPRAVGSQLLGQWGSAVAELPEWLFQECLNHVGDVAETVSLILDDPEVPEDWSLQEFVEEELLPLKEQPEAQQRDRLASLWGRLSRRERLVLNKLLHGALSMGVGKATVASALAEYAGVKRAILLQRLQGHWEPVEADFKRLTGAAVPAEEQCLPYEFASIIDWEGDEEDWDAEQAWHVSWYWDGLRVQLIKRGNAVYLWSEDEQFVEALFPELVMAARRLPDGTCLEGVLLACLGAAVLPRGALDRRLDSKRVNGALVSEVPVIMVVEDLLEVKGRDVRSLSSSERLLRLESLFKEMEGDRLRCAESLCVHSWADLEGYGKQARNLPVRGLSLCRARDIYFQGRFLMRPPSFSMKAVLSYVRVADAGRAFAEYGFALRDGEAWMPVVRVEGSLNVFEEVAVADFIKANTVGRQGPIRRVEPGLVFEILFDGVEPSGRHRSGVLLRGARIGQYLQGETVESADDLELLTGRFREKHSLQESSDPQMNLGL